MKASGLRWLSSRWLPGRKIVAVADSSFAVIDLLRAVRRRVCMITRLRLDGGCSTPVRAAGLERSGGRA